jgi:predicted alpha/beta hydrolase family esterase
MANAIILHGQPTKERYFDPAFPASSNYYWIPWLQKQLICRGIPTAAPEVPNNWKPELNVWRTEFERYDVNEGTLLIGHSCGGGFLVRWLSEHPDVKPAKVVLLAPWLNPKKLEDTEDFFEFVIDKSLPKRTNLTVIYSDDDMPQILDTVAVLKSTLPNVKYAKVHGRRHFFDDSCLEAPEVLVELTGSERSSLP